jgi:hypothetical protein
MWLNISAQYVEAGLSHSTVQQRLLLIGEIYWLVHVIYYIKF